MKIEKPGFNTGSRRFKLQPKSKKDFVPMELKARAEENRRKKMEKAKNKWPFN